MREQDAGAACIPVGVLRAHAERYAAMRSKSDGGGNAAVCGCGWLGAFRHLPAGDLDRELHEDWLAHCAALAPAQGTAGALPAAVVALLIDYRDVAAQRFSGPRLGRAETVRRIDALLTGQPTVEAVSAAVAQLLVELLGALLTAVSHNEVDGAYLGELRSRTYALLAGQPDTEAQ